MSAAPIPKTAPFADDEIEVLNRVVGTATPVQRAWLAGFLAGLDAQQGIAPANDALPAAAPQKAEPLTILYATESGNSEKLAGDVAKSARKLGFKPALVDMADLDVASLKDTKKLIVIAATWGEGEPPGRAVHAYKTLVSDAAPRLDGVEFAVLALGDTAYAEFCAIGKALDARLEALGGKRVAERVDCDLDFAEPAAKWIDGTLKILAPEAAPDAKVIAVDFGAKAAPNLDVVDAEVTETINLNSSRSEKETYHLELTFEGPAPAYKPGDSLDLYAENDPVYVDALLTAARVNDAALRADFIKGRDVTTLSLRTLETYAGFGQRYVKELLDAGTAKTWIVGRQLIDLVQEFPVALDAEKLRALTRPLSPRAYSIASSRSEVGDEAHLLISKVGYTTHNRARKGVASNYAAGLKKGARVRVKLKPNRHFALPAADRDIIMVGPGTGVAPFRAFVQERRAAKAKGRNWLFFGDREFTHDFLYQTEWQDALKDGGLTRMDVAFSRDTPEKVYVQHRLWEKRADVVAWLGGGATLYVCGDAKQMAKDVRATLVRAYADVKGVSPEAAEEVVTALERDKRYQQDVY
ncbi:MAG: flavodoxin domain-containing protein [Alphaproteobacteria bacterium]